MQKYPLTQKYILSLQLSENNMLRIASENQDNPILSAYEYFFSLSHLVGFESKCKQITDNPIHNSDTIEGNNQWASLCAEMGAISLLGNNLGVKILGFDQQSPIRKRTKSDVDILASIGSEPVYFEVKRNSREETQDIPQVLMDALHRLDLGLSFAVESATRNLSIQNIDDLIENIQTHLSNYYDWKSEYAPNDHGRPFNFVSDNMTIRFFPTSSRHGLLRYFSPPSLDDLSAYLFERGKMGKNQKEMIPMVVQAIEKGADYLICKIPKWDTYTDIIGAFFNDYYWVSKKVVEVEDEKLSGLVGMILFDKFNDFCIVNNVKASKVMKIPTVI